MFSDEYDIICECKHKRLVCTDGVVVRYIVISREGDLLVQWYSYIWLVCLICRRIRLASLAIPCIGFKLHSSYERLEVVGTPI